MLSVHNTGEARRESATRRGSRVVFIVNVNDRYSLRFVRPLVTMLSLTSCDGCGSPGSVGRAGRECAHVPQNSTVNSHCEYPKNMNKMGYSGRQLSGFWPLGPRSLGSFHGARSGGLAHSVSRRFTHIKPSSRLKSEPRSVLVLAPTWPEIHGSAAGVRTQRLIDAFSSWYGSRCQVSVATSAPCTNEAAKLLRRRLGIKTFHLPLNCRATMQSVLEATEPDIAIFDRFYMEEIHGHALRAIRPSTMRVLDMQDVHALRLARQRVVDSGGGIVDAFRTFPDASDAGIARELASVHRCDLTLVCSPVERLWLRDVGGVPDSKLTLAPLLGMSEEVPHQPLFRESPSDRTGFITLGTFRHPPNVDSLRFLLKDVWPLIRQQLPEAALTIIGSHPPSGESASFWHRPEHGVSLRGQVGTVELAKSLRTASVLLAPLRFGAGLKGKVLEAWAHGLPVVTTSIGAEGLSVADSEAVRFEALRTQACEEQHWGGRVANCANAFASHAVALHSDASLWKACSLRGQELLLNTFADAPHLINIRHALEGTLCSLRDQRAADFYGAAIWHHRQRSTEYFAKWVEAKRQARRSREETKPSI